MQIHVTNTALIMDDFADECDQTALIMGDFADACDKCCSDYGRFCRCRSNTALIMDDFADACDDTALIMNDCYRCMFHSKQFFVFISNRAKLTSVLRLRLWHFIGYKIKYLFFLFYPWSMFLTAIHENHNGHGRG